jgi:ubiquinone/menaquinone biosynthesis C-methylase UbiE
MKKFIKSYYNSKNEYVENQNYYDNFAQIYENKRGQGYHQMIDDLEISILNKYINPTDKILEVGCGTGLILKEVNKRVSKAIGIDLSENMLEKARERGLEVYHAEASKMPFEDNTFDLVYSYKVLAHIEAIEKTLQEINRVLKPNGIAVLEFYNRNSLRTFIKKIKPSNIISKNITDDSVYTRYDTIREIKYYLPSSFNVLSIKGIRIVTPAYFVYDIPFINNIFYKSEELLKDSLFAKFAGFLIVISENKK